MRLDSRLCTVQSNPLVNARRLMNSGVLYAALAYMAWGLFPIFFKQLGNVNAFEVVMHRMVWSLVFLMGVLALLRRWAWLREV